MSCSKLLGCVLAVCTQTVWAADVRVKSKYTASGQTTESVMYSNGVRQRFEYGDVAIINQCDLRRLVQVNDKAKLYALTSTGARAQAPAEAQPRKGGVVTYTASVTETGEKKQMFGHAARRLKTLMVKEPGSGACDTRAERVETDGWYIDVPTPLTCASTHQADSVPPAGGCSDEIQHKTNGADAAGYALEYTMNSPAVQDRPAVSMHMQVLEFSTDPIPAAMFDVPAGYREVPAHELMAAAGQGGPQISSGSPPRSGGSPRIGLAPVSNRSGHAIPDAMLQQHLAAHLTAAGLDAVPVQSAACPDCDYLLASDLVEVKKSAIGKLGGLLSRAPGMQAAVPKETYQARVEVRLTTAATNTPLLVSSLKSKQGAFDLRQMMSLASGVTRVAMFSHLMLLRSAFGFDPRLLDAYRVMGTGNASSVLRGIDPGLSVLARITSGMQAQGAVQGQAEAMAAASDALQQAANAVAAELKKRRTEPPR
ncbi:MAG: hypothetical protein LC130_32355 [Bryobacterales bacterium]|nr:hypothetical protein [Bryobacterales bacterium]